MPAEIFSIADHRPEPPPPALPVVWVQVATVADNPLNLPAGELISLLVTRHIGEGERVLGYVRRDPARLAHPDGAWNFTLLKPSTRNRLPREQTVALASGHRHRVDSTLRHEGARCALLTLTRGAYGEFLARSFGSTPNLWPTVAEIGPERSRTPILTVTPKPESPKP